MEREMTDKKISIVIPCFNEELLIEKCILQILSIKESNLKIQIIAVNDNSNDGTSKILEKYRNKIEIINNKRNYGKGYSVKTGCKKAEGDYICIYDADLEYDIKDYLRIIKDMEKNDVIFGIGTRYINNKNKDGFVHTKLNYIYNRLFETKLGKKLNDVNCCVKIYKKEINCDIVNNIEKNKFQYDTEIMTYILKNNIRYKEYEVSYKPRNRKQGKKINIKNYIECFYYLITGK